MITDCEYELIKDELPCGYYKGKSRPDNKLFIEAVLYIAKTGCGWRQLPPEYGKWNSIWRRFNRLSESGAFDKIFDKIFEKLKSLRSDGTSKDEEILAIDSTSIKVHQDGMRYIKKLKNREQDWKIKGRKYDKNPCDS